MATKEDVARFLAEHGLVVAPAQQTVRYGFGGGCGGGGGTPWSGIKAGTYPLGGGSITVNGKGQVTNVVSSVIPPDLVSSVFGRTGAVVALAGDYNASQITATGPDGTTDVQGAINVLSNDRPHLVWQADLRLEPNTDLTAVASHVLADGVTINTFNRTNATTFALVNGVGLNMVVAAGISRGFPSGSAGTAPAFWIDLDAAIFGPLLRQYGRGLIVWVRLGALSLPSNLNQFLVGMWQGLTPAAVANGLTNQASGGGWMNDAGTTKPAGQRTSSFAFAFRTALWTTNHWVGGAYFPGIMSGTFSTFAARVADFPDDLPENVSNENVLISTRDAASANGFAGFNMYRGRDNRAVYALCTNSAVGSPSVTIEEIGIGIGSLE